MNVKGAIESALLMVVSALGYVLILLFIMLVLGFNSCSESEDGAGRTISGNLDEMIYHNDLIIQYAQTPVCENLPSGLTYADATAIVVETLEPKFYSLDEQSARFGDYVENVPSATEFQKSWYECSINFFKPHFNSNDISSNYKDSFGLSILNEDGEQIITFSGDKLNSYNLNGVPNTWRLRGDVLVWSEKGIITVRLISRNNFEPLRGGYRE